MAKLKLFTGTLRLPMAPQPLTAMSLAHGKFSKVQKAFLAADIYLGRRILVEHSQVGLARYFVIPPADIHFAIQRQDERAAILAGLVPLVPPPNPAAQAERRLARLVRDLGHGRVAEMLAQLAPAPANDNPVPCEGDAVA
jgi:hypothetical protein